MDSGRLRILSAGYVQLILRLLTMTNQSTTLTTTRSVFRLRLPFRGAIATDPGIPNEISPVDNGHLDPLCILGGDMGKGAARFHFLADIPKIVG